MKKVLIIANLFHASPRVPGVVKYLPEFGWQPIILTTPIGENPDSRLGPPNDFKCNYRVIETCQYNLRKDIREYVKKQFNLSSKKLYKRIKPLLGFLYKFYQEITYYPDSEKSWMPFAVKSGSELLQNENINAIISSSSPITSHLIAKELKNRYKIPWIADMRDLWSQNHNYSYGPLRKIMDRRLELRTLLLADALVTVTPFWAEELRRLHGRENVYMITNGFDPEKISIGQVKLTTKFTITYTGPIYTGKNDPLKLFLALKDLIADGTMNPEDIEVRFYGPKNEPLAEAIEGYELSALVKQYGIVPREISIEKQKESQLLLLLNWEDQRGRGWHSLKIFEYMAAQRPILATGGLGNDAIKELINETKSGKYCKTVEDIKTVLIELYSEYKCKGKINYSGDIDKINKYSYREMARKFADVLDKFSM